MFEPIPTKRLLIRPFTCDDLDGFLERRNDPEVARYQDWELPYPRERGERLVADLLEMDGPENEEWWSAIVGDGSTGEVYGDVVVHLISASRTAEIGYTFARGHWGKGFAAEATTALVDYLFDTVGVTRVFGMLHPDNPASAMVQERVGMLFEGHTRLSFWLGDEVSDDWIYGMTRVDRDAWRDRPRTPPSEVGLVEVTVGNVESVLRLATHKSQERFVAPMCVSFANALFPEIVDGASLVPWMQAVVADEEIVGFVMLARSTDHHPEPYLWRLLIDRRHQRRGIGGRVLDLVAEECVAMGDGSLLTSWTEGKGSPAGFYISHGFEPTGAVVDGEVEARRRLAIA
ncbi:MAG: GNAT family N-acetyltransferase [Acidimicrobiia bacterium]